MAIWICLESQFLIKNNPPKKTNKQREDKIRNRYTALFKTRVCQIRNYKLVVLVKNFGAKRLASNAFITDPGRYRKVQEKSRNMFVNFAGRSIATRKVMTKRQNSSRLLTPRRLKFERRKNRRSMQKIRKLDFRTENKGSTRKMRTREQCPFQIKDF